MSSPQNQSVSSSGSESNTSPDAPGGAADPEGTPGSSSEEPIPNQTISMNENEKDQESSGPSSRRNRSTSDPSDQDGPQNWQEFFDQFDDPEEARQAYIDRLDEVKDNPNTLFLSFGSRRFWRSMFRYSFIVNLIQAIGHVALIVMGTVGIWYASSEGYFAVTETGKLKSLQDIGRPDATREQISQAATDILRATFNANPESYSDDLQSSRKFYAEGTHSQVIRQIRNQGYVERLQNGQRMYAVVNGAPVVEDRRQISGVYFWVVEFPFTITFQGPNERVDYELNARMSLRQAKSSRNDYGLVVRDLVFTSNE